MEHFENINEVRSRDWVTANADAGRLTEAKISRLLHRLVGQGTRTRDDSYLTGQMDMSWHDANFALSGSNHTWAVRANESHAQLIAALFGDKHIQSWNPFCNTDDQFNTCFSCLKY